MARLLPSIESVFNGKLFVVTAYGFDPNMTATISIGFVQHKAPPRRVPAAGFYLHQGVVKQSDKEGTLVFSFSIPKTQIKKNMDLTVIISGQHSLSPKIQQCTLYHRIDAREVVSRG